MQTICIIVILCYPILRPDVGINMNNNISASLIKGLQYHLVSSGYILKHTLPRAEPVLFALHRFLWLQRDHVSILFSEITLRDMLQNPIVGIPSNTMPIFIPMAIGFRNYPEVHR